MTERGDWRATALAHGFSFHTIDGAPYWNEAACFRFTLEQIETGLEDPANELEQMCLEIVADAVRSESTLDRLAIPRPFWDYVAQSWRAQEKNLYGRMDFAYDGSSPAKLLEYNADTPTSLYESSVFQWLWLEQMISRGRLPHYADQFNSLHERLVDALRRLGLADTLHLGAVRTSSEDWGTIEYLADCAAQAGIATHRIDMAEIGVTADGRFNDLDNRVITALFKLYPWEWLLREDFARHIPGSGCRFIEPAWKSILSNKGLLALLWERFPGHPNLLPAYFENDPRTGRLGSRYVRKPLYSREGANIEIVDARHGERTVSMPGPYGAEGHVLQAFHPLPEHNGQYALCGVWLIASRAAGLGMREDSGLVTTNGSRFVPHTIID
jgi:glutathionylspermidine synthase